MDLAGQFLVAMPGMDDPLFSRSVVFICDYSQEGAMGVIINKPAVDLKLAKVLTQLEMPVTADLSQAPVNLGGPVQTTRGFVLHRDTARSAPEPLVIPGGYVLTATKDILEDIGAGNGPDPYLFTLGFSGWGAGQLDNEIALNGWLTTSATPEMVFNTDRDAVWEAAVRSIGIDPLGLSAVAGRA
ncbi:putative transcriptional regulator [Sulfitobacter undariae]|uniref:UPF0301 protein GGR95_000828 n=1 Tax=Sulfitobacter undariae TaxID=1563671 RepID=A0A7W6GZ89_9RHOB|nr:YqgE/AlgH family protein [Sulfitobacter undariae]MBB3993200.1 putative transcriptional regulator [Sulfitobacter undariae]